MTVKEDNLPLKLGPHFYKTSMSLIIISLLMIVFLPCIRRWITKLGVLFNGICWFYSHGRCGWRKIRASRGSHSTCTRVYSLFNNSKPHPILKGNLITEWESLRENNCHVMEGQKYFLSWGGFRIQCCSWPKDKAIVATFPNRLFKFKEYPFSVFGI